MDKPLEDTSSAAVSSVSKASTLEAMGDFWDEHDFAELDTDAPDVVFNVSSHVSIESELLSAVEEQANMRGVTLETLVNLWLQEKLAEETVNQK